jgi:hypothetical protein
MILLDNVRGKMASLDSCGDFKMTLLDSFGAVQHNLAESRGSYPAILSPGAVDPIRVCLGASRRRYVLAVLLRYLPGAVSPHLPF